MTVALDATFNQWVAVAPCSGGVPMSTFQFMEALTVTAADSLSALAYAPINGFVELVVNGRTFMPLGPAPPFSVNGQAITWLSTIYGLTPGDEVNASYAYLGSP